MFARVGWIPRDLSRDGVVDCGCFAGKSAAIRVPSSVVFPGGTTSIFPGQFDNGSGKHQRYQRHLECLDAEPSSVILVKTAFLDWKSANERFDVEAFAAGAELQGLLVNLSTPSTTNTITGGGASLNANLELIQWDSTLIADSSYGDGVGRYIGGVGTGRDREALMDRLSGVHRWDLAWPKLNGVMKPNFMVDGYYSGAYFQRNYGLLASTATPAPTCDGVSGFTCVGFGFPSSANTNNRGRIRRRRLASSQRCGPARTTGSFRSSSISIRMWSAVRGRCRVERRENAHVGVGLCRAALLYSVAHP